jgi:hypothetical protein
MHRAISLAIGIGISLSVRAGTGVENAAVAEAMAQLDSAKILVTQAKAALSPDCASLVLAL